MIRLIHLPLQVERLFPSFIRWVWFILILFDLLLFVAGIPIYYKQLLSPCLDDGCIYFQLSPAEANGLTKMHVSLDFYASFLVWRSILVLIVTLILASILFWSRPRKGMAIYVSFALLAMVPTYLVLPEALVKHSPIWNLPVSLLRAFGIWTLIVFSYIFPDGHFYPRWTNLFALAVLLPAFSSIFIPIPSILRADNPLEWFILLVLMFSGIAGASAQISRFRSYSVPLERQQIKWVVFGFVLLTLELVGFALFPQVFPTVRTSGDQSSLYLLVSGTLNVLFMLIFLFSISTAVLKYRLWEIDILIRRSLIYSSLTGTLAVIYFLSVVLLTSLFQVFTQQNPTQLVTVFSTLTIAALFTPLRRRIQNDIDRRFFRKKYDAGLALAQFATTARNQVELDALITELLRVVQETVQPNQVSIWLRSGKEKPTPKT